jgi:mono/diheme cytochrome c family protein
MRNCPVPILSILTCCLFLLLSCKHEVVMPDGGNNGGILEVPGKTGRACSPDSVYYANTIYPLISSSCAMSGCHDSKTQAEGVDLTSYDKIRQYISPGNPTGSELYREIVKTGRERMPPPPMDPWTSDQIAKLGKWISQGARNNGCDNCDTIDFKYSTAIRPIISTKCQGCHNPASTGGNVDLSTHAGVRAVAVNGRLYGSVSWKVGYSKMPAAMKLPDCEIAQIRKWIDAGSPNN